MHIQSEFSLEARFSSLQHLPQIINPLILCWSLLITVLPPLCNLSPNHIAPRLGNGRPVTTSRARRGQHWSHWLEAPEMGEQSSLRPRADFRFHGRWQGPLWGRCKQGHKSVLGNTGLSTVGSLARQAACGPGAGHAAEASSVSVGDLHFGLWGQCGLTLLSGKRWKLPWVSLAKLGKKTWSRWARHRWGSGPGSLAFCPQCGTAGLGADTRWLTLQPRGSAACHIWCRATVLASLCFLLQVKPCHFFCWISYFLCLMLCSSLIYSFNFDGVFLAVTS